jgi:regulator of RNase E activity RraA
VYARNIPVSITGVEVSAVSNVLTRQTHECHGAHFVQGDIVFLDPEEGVVVIPRDLLDETLSLMPKLVSADDKVKDAVINGMTVAEAFKKFRG